MHVWHMHKLTHSTHIHTHTCNQKGKNKSRNGWICPVTKKISQTWQGARGKGDTKTRLIYRMAVGWSDSGHLHAGGAECPEYSSAKECGQLSSPIKVLRAWRVTALRSHWMKVWGQVRGRHSGKDKHTQKEMAAGVLCYFSCCCDKRNLRKRMAGFFLCLFLI